VTPNVGGSTKKLAEHGGFAHDDTNVVLLLSHPSFEPKTVSATVGTAQVAPTFLKALHIDPSALDAVRAEGTSVLPAVQPVTFIFRLRQSGGPYIPVCP
jgi:arylsulfatase A-like enzyme